MIELIIACMVLVTVMTFVTTLCFQINKIWKDIGHHRIAVAELSNQLESLTQLSVAEAEIELESLEPTAYCLRTLRSPQLSGKLSADSIGTRIELSINWDKPNPGQPVVLVGWIVEKQAIENVSESSAEAKP